MITISPDYLFDHSFFYSLIGILFLLTGSFAMLGGITLLLQGLREKNHSQTLLSIVILVPIAVLLFIFIHLMLFLW